mgnify:CR=1 FL=1
MLIQRVAGALLALVGLVAAVVGAWFLAHLGTSGTATFTAEPGQRVVVLEPDVLNRVDHPVEITATGSGDVWVGTARPSDVEAFFGDAQRAQVAGVDVSDPTHLAEHLTAVRAALHAAVDALDDAAVAALLAPKQRAAQRPAPLPPLFACALVASVFAAGASLVSRQEDAGSVMTPAGASPSRVSGAASKKALSVGLAPG